MWEILSMPLRFLTIKKSTNWFFLDIEATVKGRRPPIKLISEIASECFMPLSYGGGLRDLDDIKTYSIWGLKR